MKNGLVMEGGGMRGVFTAGVIDVFMENGIDFDGAVGVSAGACFGFNIKSRQIGRALRYNVNYCRDKRYCSWYSFLTSGDIFNVDFCYREIPFELDPVDFEAFKNNPLVFYAVCTDLETGGPYYARIDHCDARDFDLIRASASLPMVSHIVEVDGHLLQDGGTADSIPLRFFESEGYERNIVITTRPRDYIKKKSSVSSFMAWLYRKYPNYARAIKERHVMYNKETAYVYRREKEGAALVIAPDAPVPADRIEHDPEKLKATYEIGRRAALSRLEEIRAFLNGENLQ